MSMLLQSHPRLVVEEEEQQQLARTASPSKGKERESTQQQQQDEEEHHLTNLRCLNCSTVLLTYPAEITSSPISPKSKTGKYTMNLSLTNSKLVIGSKAIAARSNKDKNSEWSDLFRLSIPTLSTSTGSSSTTTSDETAVEDGQGGSGYALADDTSSSLIRRSTSSGSNSPPKKEDTTTISSSPALGRTSSLKRNNSTGSRTSITSSSKIQQSPFHASAKARIKHNRHELEATIAKMREAFESQSKRYLEQADILANKLKVAERKKSRRNISPVAGKKAGAAGTISDSKASENQGPIVIRGGFDGPETTDASTSPSRSQSIAATFVSSTAKSPITSPHLASAGNFPALFNSMSGNTQNSSNSSSGNAAGQSAKDATNGVNGSNNNGNIVQPTRAQSPNFRRSRSPSPSQDRSRGDSSTRDRSTGQDERAGGSSMERRTSEEAPRLAATTSKRPALNLMRDVSNLGHEMQQRKADAAAEDARGRSTAPPPGTSMPTQSSLRKPMRSSQTSSTYIPRQSGAWLRLNGLTPSPPPSQLLLNREPLESGIKEDAEGEANAEEESPRRISLSKHRHVSFKEPTPASSVEASPAPLEEPLLEQHTVEEEDEVPFDMDEDIQHLQHDEAGDEGDESFTMVEDNTPLNGIPERHSSSTSRSRSRSPARKPSPAQQPVPASFSLSTDKNGQASNSLSAILNDPTSFIGSLKSRNLGNYSMSSKISTDEAASSRSVNSPKSRVSLSDQAQRLRDLLALDAPSHRGSKSNRNKALASYLRDGQNGSKDDDIDDSQLDELAPVSALATSLPVAIGLPRFNRKEEYEFERKTSVPQKESMLVPRLRDSRKREGTTVAKNEAETSRLPALGEESEHSPVSSIGVPGNVNTGIGDALAAGNEEEDEQRDQLQELQTKQGFIPPHVSRHPFFVLSCSRLTNRNYGNQAWRFRDRPVSEVDMLGTSIHDYE
jgi:hypothetical protein